MDAFIWILLPAITAVGSALLAFYIMQARMEVVVAKEREALVEARALMKNHQKEMEERVKSAEEEARRRSLDDFLGDIHVEERHYMRENKSLFSNTKSMVLQERLYFRNLPLSNWVEHELTVEQGQTADLANLARAASVFSGQGALAGTGTEAQVAALAAAVAQQQHEAAYTPVEAGIPAGLAPKAPVGATRAAAPAFGSPQQSFGARDNRGFGQRAPQVQTMPPSAPPTAPVRTPRVTVETDAASPLAEIRQRPRLGLTPRVSPPRLARG